ncbi:MAG: TfoX/Sxy family protein [Deltaproteobacteria bacterium]|nr:TfoX/Sxy family protein [Deltaproteobacteria bacterium]
MSTELDWLRERVEAVMGARPGVTRKRMFGCDTWFRDGAIFALIWKTGRIGVKLPDSEAYSALARVNGVEPWSPGGKMIMGSWLLVPDTWNEDEDALRPWVSRAWEQAGGGAAAKKKASPKKASSKEGAPQKPAAKKAARRGHDER